MRQGKTQRLRKKSYALRVWATMPGSNRPSGTARGYGEAWRLARIGFLAKNPWCVLCLASGRRIPATDVDHIIPHKGDAKLFWDKSNWRPLCARHHASKSGRERWNKPERLGCDSDGLPLDPNHPWNKR